MTVQTSHLAAPPQVRRRQMLTMVLLFISVTINYLDRGTLAVANDSVRADLGLTMGEMGVLLSAFSWTYALCQLPVGVLVDRIGPRWLLGIGLVIWSISQAAGGFVSTFGWFVLARLALGIGEAPQFPSAARVVGNWFPPARRGTPTGIFNAASPLGIALAPLLLSPLIAAYSWEWAFWITGAAGLVVAVIWMAFYRDPLKSDLTTKERAYFDYAGADAKKRPAKVSFREWRELFTYPATWGLLLGFFGSVYLNWLYLTWLPGYLQSARHMSVAYSGLASAIPFFCGFLGALAAGYASDRIARLSSSPVTGRRNTMVVVMLGMVAFTIPATFVENNTIALACISVVICLANASSACAWSLASVVAPPSRIASLGAIQNFGGFIGGALAPLLTGFIAQTWSFVPAILTGAAMALIGAMSYLFLVRKPIPESEPNSVENASTASRLDNAFSRR
ncbi:MFS transporter [Pseudomonas baetica]|uniref:MFS transporter n=1 Tax=Pseudomonas baetica TaxID=674054 RepID=UPI003EEB8BF8